MATFLTRTLSEAGSYARSLTNGCAHLSRNSAPGSPIAQSSLDLLASSYCNLAVLHISLEYEAEIEPLDWENVTLPNLRDLRMSYCPLHSIVFTEGNTPSLVSLHIKVQEHAVEGFNVSLPELTHMDIQYVEVMLVPTICCSVHMENLLCHAIRPCH